MLSFTWFHLCMTAALRARPARRPRACAARLHVLVLEDRTLPSLFGAPTLFPGGSYPLAVTTADFNHDGKLDLATASYNDGKLNVLLGTGGGTFGPTVPYAAHTNPDGLATGDFNHDGYLDVAVSNVISNDLSFLAGNGNGTFAAANNIVVGSEPEAPAAIDLNGDGITDLVVPTYGDGGLPTVFLGGNGLSGVGGYGGFFTDPQGVAAGDFNRDGLADVAVTEATNNDIKVGLNSGGSLGLSFSNPYPVGSDPVAVAVGDFNRDGFPDLVTANTNSGNVSVLLNSGSGTFGAATNVAVSAGGNPAAVAVGDFNGDGKLDIATADGYETNTVTVLLGNGNGTFAAPLTFAVNGYPNSLAVGDYNGDGFPDLAVTSAWDNAVNILLNQTPMTTTALSASLTPTLAGHTVSLTATVTAAVDGSHVSSGQVVFLEGSTVLGSGTLGTNGQTSVTLPALPPGYHALTATYQGSPTRSPSTSAVVNQLINQVGTGTVLTASANPALVGQPLTLTATVTPNYPNDGTPMGNVQLVLDGGPVGTVPLSPGVNTFTTSSLTAGTHKVFASYLGDSTFLASNSTTLTLTVNNPAPAIASVSPATLPEGSGAFTLTVTGTGFLPNSTVQWNGSNLTTTYLSATQIQAAVPAASLADEGSALLKVTNPTPGGGASLVSTFPITDAPLTVLGTVLNVLGNKNFSGTVATFKDGNTAAPLSDFTAVISWDDGTSNFGTVSGSAGSYTVTGSHTFASFANVHTVTVAIYDKGGTAAIVNDPIVDPPGDAPASTSVPASTEPVSAAIPLSLPSTHAAARHHAVPARHHTTPTHDRHHSHTPAHHASPRRHRVS